MSPGDSQLRFIGNATVLIEWGGLAILTDPNFIHRQEQLEVAPGVKATRLHDPAIEIHELPPIDLIVLSHFHADHFDQVAERELPSDVRIFTPPTAVDPLESRGFTAVHGLDTWETEELTDGDHSVRVTALPGRHGPPVVDFFLPDVMGSLLELTGPGGSLRVYISGDTLVFDDLQEIPRRFPDIDLGLFHLGGTVVAGLMLTMDGEQGVEAMRIVAPETAIPIHFDDYDRFTSPLSDFLEAAAQAGMGDRIRVLERGAAMDLSERMSVRAR